jgi:hypothetical protein
MIPIWNFFWVKEQRLLKKILSGVILDRENPAVVMGEQ